MAYQVGGATRIAGAAPRPALEGDVILRGCTHPGERNPEPPLTPTGTTQDRSHGP